MGHSNPIDQPPATSAAAQPFFVVGSVRSGTTLLRLMLGHHSTICRCEEMEFVVGDIVDPATTTDTADYFHRLRLDRGFRVSDYTIDESLSYPEIARDFLRQRLAADGKPIAGATVHHDFDRLPVIWPEARFIFIRRDPRDVARSCVQMGFAGTPYFGADFWLNAEIAWEKLSGQVSPEQRMEIRFEDLVADSPEKMAEICHFIGIEYEPTMLEIEADTTYSRPDPAAAKSWRDGASNDEVAQVETRIGLERLRASGYEPSGTSPIPQSAYQSLRIGLLEVSGRVGARIRTYGVSLWLQGVLSRRLPFRGWRERIQLRVDDIDNQLVK